MPHGHVQVLSHALQEHTGVEGSELMLAQHQKLEEQLQELLCTPAWNPNFDALLHRYMMVGAALQRHSAVWLTNACPSLVATDALRSTSTSRFTTCYNFQPSRQSHASTSPSSRLQPGCNAAVQAVNCG